MFCVSHAKVSIREAGNDWKTKNKKEKRGKKKEDGSRTAESEGSSKANTAALLTSRPDIYDPTVPYNNHLISILLNQTIT